MKHWIIIGGLAATLAFSGCSKSDPAPGTVTTAAGGAKESTTTKAGGATTQTLSLGDCLSVATANLGLIGGEKDSADKLKSFNPPSEVAAAADVLVAKGGLKITGDNQDETVAASKTVSDWVEAVCPKG